MARPPSGVPQVAAAPTWTTRSPHLDVPVEPRRRTTAKAIGEPTRGGVPPRAGLDPGRPVRRAGTDLSSVADFERSGRGKGSFARGSSQGAWGQGIIWDERDRRPSSLPRVGANKNSDDPSGAERWLTGVFDRGVGDLALGVLSYVALRPKGRRRESAPPSLRPTGTRPHVGTRFSRGFETNGASIWRR